MVYYFPSREDSVKITAQGPTHDEVARPVSESAQFVHVEAGKQGLEGESGDSVTNHSTLKAWQGWEA